MTTLDDIFLAVQNRSIGLIVRPLLCVLPLTIRVFTTLQSDPRDLWPLGHLIRVMRRHDLKKRSTYLPTYLPTSLHPYIREHHSRAYLSMTFSFLMYMGSSALLHILPLRHFIRVMRRHDLNFWPQFWPQFLTSIFDLNFWQGPQGPRSIFDDSFW